MLGVALFSRRLALGVCCALVGCLGGASSAAAVSAWWHVSAVSYPSAFHGGVARDEVEELKVNADGGDVLWASASNPFAEHVTFPYNASDQEVQAALEAFYGYAPGSVEVSGGPKEPDQAVMSEAEPYVLRFKGRQAPEPTRSSDWRAFSHQPRVSRPTARHTGKKNSNSATQASRR